MKRLFKNGVIGVVLFLLNVFLLSSYSFGQNYVKFNADHGDASTVSVSNATSNPCKSGPEDGCWTPSVDGKIGDKVSVGLYYHNTSNETVYNVSLGLSLENSGVDTVHVFRGGISYPSVNILGVATVHLSSYGKLVFIPGSIRFYPNQSKDGRAVSGENLLFSKSGFSIGNVAPGMSSQGSLVATFQVQ